MKQKDILCVFLLLLLIYILMKPNYVEGLNIQGSVSRHLIKAHELGKVVPVQHSHSFR